MKTLIVAAILLASVILGLVLLVGVANSASAQEFAVREFRTFERCVRIIERLAFGPYTPSLKAEIADTGPEHIKVEVFGRETGLHYLTYTCNGSTLTLQDMRIKS